MKQIGWRRCIKRALDCTVAAVGLAVTAPILAGAALAIRATMGSPVLFRQQRPGLHGKPFVLTKFRTMHTSIGADGRPLADAQRLTPLGALLRSTSVDELPQLLNVLRGDLSLVGPRPLLMQYLMRYSPEQARRHDVMPGLTGLAQISGRNTLAWSEKFRLDVWYVDHWSLVLDLRILARTLYTVIQRTGVSNEGHVTMPEFMGVGVS